jgi:hypothetical protein
LPIFYKLKEGKDDKSVNLGFINWKSCKDVFLGTNSRFFSPLFAAVVFRVPALPCGNNPPGYFPPRTAAAWKTVAGGAVTHPG